MSLESLELKREIGMRVHKIRVEKQYTQAQFAEEIDISINFLSEIENGKKGMSQETIYKLCERFNISADYLLFGTDTSEPPAVLTRISDVAVTLTSAELSYVIKYLESLKKMKDLNL